MKRGVPVVSDGTTEKVPPFLKNRKVANGDDARKAKSEAAARRLAAMKAANKPGGK